MGGIGATNNIHIVRHTDKNRSNPQRKGGKTNKIKRKEGGGGEGKGDRKIIVGTLQCICSIKEKVDE